MFNALKHVHPLVWVTLIALLLLGIILILTNRSDSEGARTRRGLGWVILAFLTAAIIGGFILDVVALSPARAKLAWASQAKSEAKTGNYGAYGLMPGDKLAMTVKEDGVVDTDGKIAAEKMFVVSCTGQGVFEERQYMLVAGQFSLFYCSLEDGVQDVGERELLTVDGIADHKENFSNLKLIADPNQQ